MNIFSIIDNYEKLAASVVDGLENLEVKDPESIQEIPSFCRFINGGF